MEMDIRKPKTWCFVCFSWSALSYIERGLASKLQLVFNVVGYL